MLREEVLSARGSISRPSTYTRDSLMSVYESMVRDFRGSLPVPKDADIPTVFSKSGPKLGLAELESDQWVYVDSRNGAVHGPTLKQEILRLLKTGQLEPDCLIVPFLWLTENATKLKDMLEVWSDSDKKNREAVHYEERHTAVTESQNNSASCRPRITDDDLRRDRWLYKDISGKLQGPYSCETMLSWWTDGYFGQDLLIRAERWEANCFAPLRMLLIASCASDEKWMYKDENGQLQGPYSREQMIHWFEQGYMPLDLPTRPAAWEKDEFLLFIQVLVKWIEVSEQLVYKDSRGIDQGPVSKKIIIKSLENGQLARDTLAKPAGWVVNRFVPLHILLECL